MKICKNGEAFAIQKTLLCVRIHGKNFPTKMQMFFQEYKKWFLVKKMTIFLIKIDYIF